MAEIVVIDIETTGFGEYDRIIEVAGVIYETDGDFIIGEFETLVNPLRSITTDTSLKSHKLTAEPLSAAPTFAEVGPWLAKIFHRRPVIHYSSGFDDRFLNGEFTWAGIEFRLSQVASAKKSPLELTDAARNAGHDLLNNHSALADARAALAVARHIGWDQILSQAGRNEHLADMVEVTSHRTLSRFQAGIAEQFDMVRFERGREFRELSREDEYLFLLDELLEDMELSEDELRKLSSFADTAGLSHEVVQTLNQRYLANIETAVLRNGYVSKGEMDLVFKFSELLGVKPTIEVTETGEIVLEPDALITATSTAIIDGKELSKEELGKIVTDLGYRFTEDFRKKDGVSLLLIPAEGHISRNTRKAVSWGTPQMTVANFLKKFA